MTRHLKGDRMAFRIVVAAGVAVSLLAGCPRGEAGGEGKSGAGTRAERGGDPAAGGAGRGGGERGGKAEGGGERRRGDRAGGGEGGGPRGGGRAGGRGQGPVAVALAPIARRDLAETMTLTGTLEAARRVAVAPRSAGALVEVGVELGDAVKAGQLVARLDDAEPRERLAQADAAVGSARAQAATRAVDLRQAELSARRERELYRQAFTARQDLEAAEARLASARALARLAASDVARAEALRREARETLARTRLLAPMAGVVGARHLDPGATVAAGAAVVTIVATGALKSVVQVSDSVLPRLRPGTPATVRVDAWPGRAFAARVARVAPIVDPGTRMGAVELAVDEPGQSLRPGMLARVELPIAVRKAVAAVPRDAVVTRGDRSGVFVVEDEKARLVPVRTGMTAGAWVELVEGPAVGTRVVTLGNHLLRDGAPVREEGERRGSP